MREKNSREHERRTAKSVTYILATCADSVILNHTEKQPLLSP
jgi:hypothetical protein